MTAEEFKRYLDLENIKKSEFADFIGVEIRTVDLWLRGARLINGRLKKVRIPKYVAILVVLNAFSAKEEIENRVQSFGDVRRQSDNDLRGSVEQRLRDLRDLA